MALLALGGSTFEKCPSGMHHAVCVDVEDLGVETSDKYFDEKGNPVSQHKVRFTWQIEEPLMDDGRRFIVSKKFTLSLNEKAALRKFLEAWRGVAFTKEDLSRGFDVEKLLGVNCTIQVIHSEDGKWANVQAVMPPTKGAARLEPANYTRRKDRPKDTGDFDRAFTGSIAPSKKGIDLSNVEPAF